MKAAELRIGNILYYGDGELIVGINVLRDIDTYIQLGAKPIELTKERLLSAGFEEEKNSWFSILYTAQIQDSVTKLSINLITGSVSIIDWDEGTPSYIGYSVKYVHQLQNLYFALTGEELITSIS